MSNSKDLLAKYEDESKYVFHGSLNGKLAMLEPRQALSFQKPDGDPAVFAASSIEPAIFMAVLGSRRAAGWDSSKFVKPFGFYISESNWRRAQEENWQGYVYVLDRMSFVKGTGWVWRSAEKSVPIAKFLVGINDVPSAMTILPDGVEAKYVKQHS